MFFVLARAAPFSDSVRFSVFLSAPFSTHFIRLGGQALSRHATLPEIRRGKTAEALARLLRY